MDTQKKQQQWIQKYCKSPLKTVKQQQQPHDQSDDVISITWKRTMHKKRDIWIRRCQNFQEFLQFTNVHTQIHSQCVSFICIFVFKHTSTFIHITHVCVRVVSNSVVKLYLYCIYALMSITHKKSMYKMSSVYITSKRLIMACNCCHFMTRCIQQAAHTHTHDVQRYM